MKWIFMFFIATGLTFCEQTKKEAEPPESGGKIQWVETILKVEGMTCGSCEYHVDKAAKKVNGVSYCKANSHKGQAVIKYNPAKADIKDIIASITKLGYKANVQ